MNDDWRQDFAGDGELIGHYYEAINTALDAEKLLQQGGAIAKLIAKARDDAVESLAQIVRWANMDQGTLTIHRERIKLYENLVGFVNSILDDGTDAAEQVNTADAETLRTIVSDENSVGDD